MQTVLILIFSLSLQLAIGQIKEYNLDALLSKNIKCSQKMLKKRCPKDRYNDFASNNQIDELDFVPISLFYVSKQAKGFKESDRLIDFIKFKKKEPLLGFLTYNEEQFVGVMDLSDEVHFNLSKDCTYWEEKKSSAVRENPLYIGYLFLRKQEKKPELLFGVKYFLNSLWFLENDKYFVLDLKENKIYDPKDFISKKCESDFIEVLANGGQTTCNH